jgi:hypothetical protein
MNATPVEEWRAIPGYEGYYEASDLGRVRSLDRPYVNRRGYRCHVKGRVLASSRHKFGYAKVILWRGNEPTHFNVHVLVMAAFVGPLVKGQHTRHLNGDPTDNRLANLAYGTVSENQLDSVRHGFNKEVRKTHCPQGHPYDERNTYHVDRPDRPGRGRRCRECNRIRCAAKHQERRRRRAQGAV